MGEALSPKRIAKDRVEVMVKQLWVHCEVLSASPFFHFFVAKKYAVAKKLSLKRKKKKHCELC